MVTTNFGIDRKPLIPLIIDCRKLILNLEIFKIRETNEVADILAKKTVKMYIQLIYHHIYYVFDSASSSIL